MTSIYQPPDLVINKPLNNAIKRQYKMYRNAISNTFVPGAEIKISHNILHAYEQINDDNMSHCYIHNSFDISGLSPSVREKKLEHLDSLTLASAYNALIDTHLVEKLELEIEEELKKDS
jgi:hypothetical protein